MLATSLVQSRWGQTPRVAVILGTGLGDLAASMEQEEVIPYAEIPHFPRSTALSHKGQLICGYLRGVPVVAMDGRCHFYEGYSFRDITLPVRTVAQMGAEVLIVSNASGALNPRFRAGDLMLIEDHISVLCASAISPTQVGQQWTARGRLRPMYDTALLELASQTARRENILTRRGVYAAVTGPNYETRAEYRALRRMGGDAVGMSTVPEVLAATDTGMRVLGLSAITNVAGIDAPSKTDAHEVVDTAAEVEPRIRKIVERVVESQGADPVEGGRGSRFLNKKGARNHGS